MLPMGLAMEAQPARAEHPDGRAKHIVFFDVETNVPGHLCRSYELLEFGAVVLDARGLGELRSFHTLIRPRDISCIDRRTTDCNTITSATVADAPTFADVADEIYQLLHGHIWAGHNILRFDNLRVKEAFLKIGRLAPQPSGVVDTYPLLRRTFGKRAGNYKLATLASYCGYGKQEHRSIADVRMNINVLRSCATVLFLESNYPDIFMAQLDVSTVLEQSASFSTSYPQNGFLGNDSEEQEVDSQIRSINRAEVHSSATRTSAQSRSCAPFKMDNDSEIVEEIISLRRIELSSAFEAVELDALDDMGKEGGSTLEGQPHSSCSRVLMEDEEFVSAKLSGVHSVLEIDHIQHEDVLTGHESASENASAAKIMDLKLEKVEILTCLPDADEALLQDELMVNKSVAQQDLSHALNSLTLGKNSQDMEAAGAIISGVDSSSPTMAQLSTSCLRTEFEGVPFLLASHVILPSIEVRSFGSSNTLYYNGFPLNVLEFKVRVRFTIHPSYALDDKGKPRFSILIEPSEAACNIIRKYEDLAKSMTAVDSEVEWLPALRKESECWAGRMSIGTKWTGSFWTYTTEFYRSTSNGLEKISLDPVDPSTFRSVLPHGSIIDIGYGFYIFNVNNRRGVRFLAKHITLC